MYTNNNTYFIDYFERNDFLSLLFEDLSFSVFNKYYCFMNCNICYLIGLYHDVIEDTDYSLDKTMEIIQQLC
jgi:hypothetical protein